MLSRFLFKISNTIHVKKLNNRKTIQKICSFFLLVVFAFSITPKIYFHDVIANHKDAAPSCDHPQKVKACLHQTGYNCHVDELVVRTPYLILENFNSLSITSHFPEFNSAYQYSLSWNCLLHKESRGPPMV